MQSIVEHDEQRQVPLTAEDVDRAAAEIAAMGAIPALQEGFAVFNLGLVGVGWHPPCTSSAPMARSSCPCPNPVPLSTSAAPW